MARVQLQIYVDPGELDVIISITRKDGGEYRMTAIVDTGAEYSLFPIRLLDQFQHRIVDTGELDVEQAGIARQAFKAIVADVDLFLEDANGLAYSSTHRESLVCGYQTGLAGFCRRSRTRHPAYRHAPPRRLD
jgi:hypothetical protein